MNQNKPKPRKSKLELREPAKSLNERLDERPLDPNHPAALIYAEAKRAELSMLEESASATDLKPGEAGFSDESHLPDKSHLRGKSHLPDTSALFSDQEGVYLEALVPEKALYDVNAQTLASYAETINYRKGDSRINHDFFDHILTKLSLHAQMLYFHLNRYREGQSDLTIPLNWGKLEVRTHICKTTLWRAAKLLEANGLAKKEDYQYGRNKEQGFRFRLFSPKSLLPDKSHLRGKSHLPEKDNKKKEEKQTIKRDLSDCPDCKGAGFFYPEGFDKGVKKCNHRHLSQS